MPTIQVSVNQVGPSTSEGSIRKHKVLIDRPEAKGGEDKGAMGGELLLLSLGGCFLSNLLEAIRTREADIHNVAIAIEGTLEGSPAHFTSIALTVQAEHSDKAQLEKLVTISERSCIVANTLKGSVDLSFKVV
jgi:putative redox protein